MHKLAGGKLQKW